MKEILDFITELKENNNREWFQANKKKYEDCKRAFHEEVEKIIEQLQLSDIRITGVKAKDTVFRIYRDVRFSKDKSPYKTHFAAYIARGGRKSPEAGYYFHIGDDELFLAGGVYAPQKEELHAIRSEILYNPNPFIELLEKAKNEGFELYEQDKLKKGPKDFPSDSPYIEILKNKHFILTKNFNKKNLLSKEFISLVISDFTKTVPFNNYINTAIEFKGNE